MQNFPLKKLTAFMMFTVFAYNSSLASTNKRLLEEGEEPPAAKRQRLEDQEKRNPDNLSPEEAEFYQKGLAYRKGEVSGYPKDSPNTLEMALPIFESLAKKGHPESMHNLAMVFFKQGKNVEAIEWFSKAAQNGIEEAQRNLEKIKKSEDSSDKNPDIKPQIKQEQTQEDIQKKSALNDQEKFKGNWTQEFVLRDGSNILHTPQYVNLGGMMQAGKGLSLKSKFYNDPHVSSWS